MHAYLDKPLTQIPDPFGRPRELRAITTMRCFATSSTVTASITNSCRRPIATPRGRFDDVMRKVLRSYDAIMGVMLPTLREDRRKTYSPVLPISPDQRPRAPGSGRGRRRGSGPDRVRGRGRQPSPAVGARRRCQAAMEGRLGGALGRARRRLRNGGQGSDRQRHPVGQDRARPRRPPPEGFNYEMFLDEKGEKISKSKGNGLSLEEWLRYGSEASLSFYIYREPKRAKSLHIGVIPRAVDEYWQFRGNYPGQPVEQQARQSGPSHPRRQVPDEALPLTYGLLLNLVACRASPTRKPRGGSSSATRPGTSPETDPELDELIGLAVNYARDFVVPTLQRRAPSEMEAEALQRPRFRARRACPPMHSRRHSERRCSRSASATRSRICAAGSRRCTRPCSAHRQGPRMGSFIALYGIDNSRRLIAEALGRGWSLGQQRSARFGGC